MRMKRLPASFVLVNLALTFFFGCLHQGGVIPSLAWLRDNVPAGTGAEGAIAVYYKTYPPPTFVSRYNAELNILDFRLGQEQLMKYVKKSKCESQSHREVYIVTPTPVLNELKNDYGSYYSVAKRIPWHLSTEDLPTKFDELNLDIVVIKEDIC